MAMVMENQQPLARMPPLVPPAPPPPPPPLPQAYKHRCRVCKKGFMCGRALGGHMRAHGVADDDGLSADDDDGDDSGPGGGGSSEAAASAPASSTATANKRMSYALRANPGRLKNCRVCENCGKEFTSWKSLLDHGRCNYDEEEGDLDGGGAGNNDDGEELEDLALAAGWSKGKRTRRAKVTMAAGNNSSDEQVPAPSTEEEDLANFLVMLSSSSSSAARPHVVVEVDQESCTARKKAEQRNHQLLVPQPISMVAPTPPPQVMPQLLAPPQVVQQQHNVSTVPRGMFECKACKKVFTSHQALGGHRASHKKVKGCFAAKLESNRSDPPPQPVATSATDSNVKVVNDAIPAIIRTEQKTADGNAEGCTTNAGTAAGVVMATAAPEMAVMQQVDEVPVAAPSAAAAAAAPFKKKGKVHECSICHRVFMSGQALGGHKRCHWLTTGAGDPMAKLQPFVTQDHVMHAMCQQLTLGRPMFDASDPFLDLNVPTNAAAAEPAAAARQAVAEMNDGVLSLNAPASLYMHSWAAAGHSNASNMNNTATSGHYDPTEATTVTEDEADSTSAKRAKISDLKDMNMAGETSPWLQVGIGLPSEMINEKQATHEE